MERQNEGPSPQKQDSEENKPEIAMDSKQEESACLLISESFPSNLIEFHHDGSERIVSSKQALFESGTKVIGLHFDDNSNVDCPEMKSVLTRFINEIQEHKYPIKVVHIPTTKQSEDPHREILSTGFDEDICKKLMNHFDVQSVPSLIFVNQHGEVLYGSGMICLTMDEPCDAAEQLMLLYQQNEMMKTSLKRIRNSESTKSEQSSDREEKVSSDREEKASSDREEKVADKKVANDTVSDHQVSEKKKVKLMVNEDSTPPSTSGGCCCMVM